MGGKCFNKEGGSVGIGRGEDSSVVATPPIRRHSQWERAMGSKL